MLHDLLLRQLRKLGCDPNTVPTAETWRFLLEDVSRRYEENDRARHLLDRSLEIADREMRDLNAGLVAERDRFSHLFRHSPVGMARIDLDGAIAEVNPQFARILGQPAAALLGRPAASLVLPSRREQVRQMLAELERGERTEVSSEEPLASPTGSTIFTKFTASAVHDERGTRTQLIVVIEDISAWTHHQVELQHTQKLESVGRLAAGIAHEINTPMQFVGTNVTFLESAFSDLLTLCDVYRQACDKAAGAALAPADLTEIRAAEETADLSYLRENVPRALVSSEDGIKRVGKIVHSMKSFAHPNRGARSAADINAALESTLTVANSELRYVAEVETDFAPLPHLPCFLNDLNQVFLNLLVNAAHAVADVVGTSGNKGRGAGQDRTGR